MRTRGKHYLRNLAKREAAKRRLFEEVYWQWKDGEFDGPVVDDLSEVPEGYAGLVIEVNDHGNVSLTRAFKNGNTHYVYGIV